VDATGRLKGSRWLELLKGFVSRFSPPTRDENHWNSATEQVLNDRNNRRIERARAIGREGSINIESDSSVEPVERTAYRAPKRRFIVCLETFEFEFGGCELDCRSETRPLDWTHNASVRGPFVTQLRQRGRTSPGARTQLLPRLPMPVTGEHRFARNEAGNRARNLDRRVVGSDPRARGRCAQIHMT